MPLTKSFQSLGSTTEMTGDSQHSFDKTARLTASWKWAQRITMEHAYSLLKGCIAGNFLLIWSFCLNAACPPPAPILKFLYVGYAAASGPRWLQFELPSDIKAFAVGSDAFTWKVIMLELPYNDRFNIRKLIIGQMCDGRLLKRRTRTN